jgi:hypothetical protein
VRAPDRGIVWVPTVEGDGARWHSPYFLAGERWTAVTAEGVDLHPRDLLFGILLGYDVEPPSVDAAAGRPRLVEVLRVLADGFGEASLESLILNASAHLREAHGIAAGRRALRNGALMLPDSSRIRADLMFHLSESIPGAGDDAALSLSAEILGVADGVKPEEVREDLREPLFRVWDAARVRLVSHGAPGRWPRVDDGFPLDVIVKF